MAFISVYRPSPGWNWYRFRARRFHLAREWTTTAVSFTPRMSKDTGRSTPFRSSFRPEEAATNRGADTRWRRRAPLSRSSNRRLSRPMAFWVS